jgi:hypothetical protein
MGKMTEESRWWDKILHFVQNDTGEIPLNLPFPKGEVISSFEKRGVQEGHSPSQKLVFLLESREC